MDVLKIFVAIAVVITSRVCAQQKTFENLSIDRPDISNLPHTVKPKHFQFEIGGETYKNDYAKEKYLPNFLLRTGINSRSELRIGINNFIQDSLHNNNKEKILFATVSGKYRFVEEKGWWPSVAIQPEVGIPFGKTKDINEPGETNLTMADYALLLLFNDNLHEKMYINYNIGVIWNKKEKVDYLISASTSFAHTHRLSYFLELYSLIEDPHEFPINFDGGLAFLVAPRFQIDAYFGNREDGELRYWFYGAGVGFRVDANDLKPKSFKEIGIHH